MAEVPAVTPRPTAEVSNTRRSVPALLAPRENPGLEELARGPTQALALAPASEEQAQARLVLCVTRIPVGERRSVMRVWTGLATRDQSVPVRKFS